MKGQKIKIVNVVGARPNFMKVAPLLREMSRRSDAFEPVLLHTGQHSDREMNDVFFDDLELPSPAINLGISGGTHAEQTGRVLIETEKVLMRDSPDCVLVVGDVNSSLAAALAATKLHIPVAHVEAGLRSFNRRMPEEVNRVLIDHISSFLFIHESSARDNLLREGLPPDKIHFVGNVMIDSLLWALQKARASSQALDRLGLEPKSFGLVTLHRPENVDDPQTLRSICHAMAQIARRIQLIWPMHPRTRKRLSEFGLENEVCDIGGLILLEPMGYLDFLNLMAHSRIVLTDSGGVQEETTALGVPCVTVRQETERPITVIEGTNVVAGTCQERIVEVATDVLEGRGKEGIIPALWDGKSAGRIVDVLQRELA